MNTVTICGSTRFQEIMKRVAFILEIKYGFNVIQCTYNEDNIDMNEKEYQNLIQAHNQKIMLSDAIFVININGYIGEQTKKEIILAKENNKKILYYSEFMKEENYVRI